MIRTKIYYRRVCGQDQSFKIRGSLLYRTQAASQENGNVHLIHFSHPLLLIHLNNFAYHNNVSSHISYICIISLFNRINDDESTGAAAMSFIYHWISLVAQSVELDNWSSNFDSLGSDFIL